MNDLFSIIIPSFNQPKYIGKTLENLKQIKQKALQKGIALELLLFDGGSKLETIAIIDKYRSVLDHVEITADNGQYDAINKGIKRMKGNYWTWVNTDDYIDLNGFFELINQLMKDCSIDYIYGNIEVIDEYDKRIKVVKSCPLTIDLLVNREPSIFQPGSFMKTSKTKEIGYLRENNCCFDYEYILRLLKSGAKFKHLDTIVAQFRYYHDSKSGSIVPEFIKEQLIISKQYGRKKYSFLSFFLNLRLIKHKFFPRK